MPKITELYAFVAEGSGPDDEGVIAVSMMINGMPMFTPLVGADMDRIKSLELLAAQVGKQVGKKIKLLHFTNREEIKNQRITIIQQVGSQKREVIENTSYTLIEIENGDATLFNKDTGKYELWHANDDFAGYVIQIDGIGYEFVRVVS